MLTDFDSSMCAAIESVFSETVHLLCQWHFMQNLKKHFVYLSKRKHANSKMMYNHLMDCIFCDSPKRFRELQDIIFASADLDAKKLEHLRKLFLIKEKWSTAH